MGEDATERLAVAAAPGAAWLLVAVLVVFVTEEFAVTVCVIVQVPPAMMVAPLMPTVEPPLVPPESVADPAPEQLTLPAAELARPAG